MEWRDDVRLGVELDSIDTKHRQKHSTNSVIEKRLHQNQT